MKTIQTSFTRFELTQEEVKTGAVLNTVQLAVLQNYRADVAEQKLNLSVDTADVNKFIQEEAFLKGQLLAIQYLIDTSEAAEKLAVEEALQARVINQQQ